MKWPSRDNLCMPTIDRQGPGQLSFWFYDLDIHVLPFRRHWGLGYWEEPLYDGDVMYNFGFGPLLLCSWS